MAKLKVRGNAGSPLDGTPSKHCATLEVSRSLRMGRSSSPPHHTDLADVAAERRATIMPRRTVGIIEIPNAAGSAFDHGAFDPETRRVFVAHTARDCVEVID